MIATRGRFGGAVGYYCNVDIGFPSQGFFHTGKRGCSILFPGPWQILIDASMLSPLATADERLLDDGILREIGRLSRYARRGTSCMWGLGAIYESYDILLGGLGCVALVLVLGTIHTQRFVVCKVSRGHYRRTDAQYLRAG